MPTKCSLILGRKCSTMNLEGNTVHNPSSPKEEAVNIRTGMILKATGRVKPTTRTIISKHISNINTDTHLLITISKITLEIPTINTSKKKIHLLSSTLNGVADSMKMLNLNIRNEESECLGELTVPTKITITLTRKKDLRIFTNKESSKERNGTTLTMQTSKNNKRPKSK